MITSMFQNLTIILLNSTVAMRTFIRMNEGKDDSKRAIKVPLVLGTRLFRMRMSF